MRRTSLLIVILFSLAILANVRYLFFLLDPVHADNLGFYAITVFADLVVIMTFTSTWAIALYFEVSKPRYYREISELRKIGQPLLGNNVAVLITVVSEDLSVVRNTIQCAKNLIGNKEVYVLDDGRKAETRELALQMSVHYIVRCNNDFHKAGNLNNWLKHHNNVPFFIVVDADFALDSKFIQRTLPLFHDPRVAAVQTPQIYSNEETLFSRGCEHLQDIFYHYIQPGKHLLGSAFSVGTNMICRSSSFFDIGGFAEESDSEDLFTTLKLLEHKYRVLFLDEPLAVGLSPTSLISFYNQYYRWARGGIRMLLKNNTLFNSKLQPEQRMQFFLSNVFYLTGVSVFIYLLSPLIAILVNIKPFSDTYIFDWYTSYLPFVIANVGLSMILMKKYRAQALVLGIFSSVPYMNALCSTLVGKTFRWKITNTRSKGIITKILTPYIIYLVIVIATSYFLMIGILAYNPVLILYYVWLFVDTVLVFVCIVCGYIFTTKTSVPTFSSQETIETTTAEILAVAPKASATTKEHLQKAFEEYVDVEETPTIKLKSILTPAQKNGKHS